MNHKSSRNFLLKQDRLFLYYTLSGGTQTPSWDGPIELAAITSFNNSGFNGKMRVKKAGKDSNQSRSLSLG